MTAEVGHNAGSVYIGQDGNLHLHDGKVLDSTETDITSTLNLSGAVTATPTELNKLGAVTAGTVTASKALVVDASKDLATIHKLTFSQEVVHGSVVSQTKSATYTMTAADSGYITYVDTDAFVITLPATVAGYTYTFVNAGADAAVLITLSPNASDKIQGVGLTSQDDKDLLNTKATAKKGDMVRIVGDGTNGWLVQQMHGTWAREA